MDDDRGNVSEDDIATDDHMFTIGTQTIPSVFVDVTLS